MAHKLKAEVTHATRLDLRRRIWGCGDRPRFAQKLAARRRNYRGETTNSLPARSAQDVGADGPILARSRAAPAHRCLAAVVERHFHVAAAHERLARCRGAIGRTGVLGVCIEALHERAGALYPRRDARLIAAASR